MKECTVRLQLHHKHYTTCGDSSLSKSHFGITQVQTQVSEVTLTHHTYNQLCAGHIHACTHNQSLAYLILTLDSRSHKKTSYLFVFVVKIFLCLLVIHKYFLLNHKIIQNNHYKAVEKLYTTKFFI